MNKCREGCTSKKAPPLSRYSKLLITASCEYEEGQGDEQSHYCPGYSDIKVTPYEGTKRDKLTQMAKVFCSHCQPEDTVCQQLFCPPEELIVNVTISLLGTFCEDIQSNFPACYKEFCTSSLTKRQVRSVDSGYPQATNLNGQYECKASLPWSGVAGMDKWCRANCINGNDVAVCTEQFCDCSQKPTTTTTTASSRNQPTPCTEWKASGIYSGTAGMDSWCQSVCSGGRCPQTHCQCKVTTTTTSERPSTTSSGTTTLSTPTTTTEMSTTDSVTTTGLPTTSIDSVTTTGLPTTSTDSVTTTELPTTRTDSVTTTGLPITSTDSVTTTGLPITSTDSVTTTGLPTTRTDSVTTTGLSTTSTDSVTITGLSTTNTTKATSTIKANSTTNTSTGIPNIVTTTEPFSSSANILTTSISQRTTTGAESTTLEPATSAKNTQQSSTSMVPPHKTSSRDTVSSIRSTTGLQPTTSSSGTKETSASFSVSPESSRTTKEYLPSSPSSTSTPSYTISTAEVLTSTRAYTTSPVTSSRSTDLPTSTQRDMKTESPLPTTGASSIKSFISSTIASTYTPTMIPGTSKNGPKETTLAPSTNSSAISTGSSQPFSKTPLMTSTATVSTKAPEIGNVTDEDSLKLIDDIICDHAIVQGHNTITKRFCGKLNNAAVVEKMGYADDVVDQVLTFAPKLLCSLTDGTPRTDACNNMFCGESPLSQRMVRSVLCNVCDTLIVSGGSMCSNIYCEKI